MDPDMRPVVHLLVIQLQPVLSTNIVQLICVEQIPQQHKSFLSVLGLQKQPASGSGQQRPRLSNCKLSGCTLNE